MERRVHRDAGSARRSRPSSRRCVRCAASTSTSTPGEFVAVMGPSGCGKSTLLNLVAGLDVADEGDDHRSTVRRSPAADEDDLARMRRKHIGIVFQFFNLLEGMTVLENVVLPAVIAGTKREPAETRARDMLDLLGLGDKAKELPGVLSGGQRQRLAIARALANEPTLLLADEPTGAARQRRWSRGARAVQAAARRRADDPHGDAQRGSRRRGRPHRAHARRTGRERQPCRRAARQLRRKSRAESRPWVVSGSSRERPDGCRRGWSSP